MPKVHEILITFQERTPCEIAQSVDLKINSKPPPQLSDVMRRLLALQILAI